MPWLATPVAAALAAAGFAVPVLRRMQREYTATETFRPSTVALLYSAYAANGAALSWAARRGSWPLPLPRRPAALAGAMLATAGAGAAIAGISRFNSSGQISGTEAGSLIATGLYRTTRNPQYLGLSSGLVGVALATRSGLVGAIAGFATIVLNQWIPNEERHLARVFGDEYRAYTANVPRWI